LSHERGHTAVAAAAYRVFGHTLGRSERADLDLRIGSRGHEAEHRHTGDTSRCQCSDPSQIRLQSFHNGGIGQLQRDPDHSNVDNRLRTHRRRSYAESGRQLVQLRRLNLAQGRLR
jgi:hypothetical protein